MWPFILKSWETECKRGDVESVTSTVLADSRTSLEGPPDYFYPLEHSHASKTATPLLCPIPNPHPNIDTIVARVCSEARLRMDGMISIFKAYVPGRN